MNVMGIIFANEDSIGTLTEKRTMASLPFGGRYRQVDFALSNLCAAGVHRVGIIPRHRKLFGSRDMVILENLKDLHLCSGGLIHLSCCPLKTENSDGAPVRAIAWFD